MSVNTSFVMGRWLNALLFVMSAIGKASNWTGTLQLMKAHNIPLPKLGLAGSLIVEMAGGGLSCLQRLSLACRNRFICLCDSGDLVHSRDRCRAESGTTAGDPCDSIEHRYCGGPSVGARRTWRTSELSQCLGNDHASSRESGNHQKNLCLTLSRTCL